MCRVKTPSRKEFFMIVLRLSVFARKINFDILVQRIIGFVRLRLLSLVNFLWELVMDSHMIKH